MFLKIAVVKSIVVKSVKKIIRGTFTIISNSYDGAFLQK